MAARHVFLCSSMCSLFMSLTFFHFEHCLLKVQPTILDFTGANDSNVSWQFISDSSCLQTLGLGCRHGELIIFASKWVTTAPLTKPFYCYVRKKFLQCRINYYTANSTATFNPSIFMIIRSRVNIQNPGPYGTVDSQHSKHCSSNINCALLNSRSLKAIVNDPATGQKNL